MASYTISRTDLVGIQSLSFIRPQRLSFSIADTKPLTRMYAFFDGKDVSAYITPSGGTIGGVCTTDASGKLTGTFDIPSKTFNTGSRVLKFTDSPDFDAASVPGATTGTASATFTAAGVLRSFRDTVTTVNININRIIENRFLPAPVRPLPQPIRDTGGGGRGDPLAQTFFTHGIKDGCFITKIDLYFQSKDAAIPVRVELRNVINGYPSEELVNEYSVVSLNPSQVNISNNASAVTTFTFSRPIYLKEDSDFCFVLFTNSNTYNVFTSELGAKSIETGKTIFEQPFVGTMFKSENNSTWSAYQTEDVKFTLYKAKFTTGVDNDAIFAASAKNILVRGLNMSTTLGSSIIRTDLEFQHGFKTGQRIVLQSQANGNYRGISNTVLNNSNGFVVTVIDEYSFTFNAGVVATSTGKLISCGYLTEIQVEKGGTGYTNPTITVNSDGVNATATAVVVAGEIVYVTINTPGSGFTTIPTLTIVDSVGSFGFGAKLNPVSDAIFVIAVNRPYQQVEAIIDVDQPPGTLLTAEIKTTDVNYITGSYQELPYAESILLRKNAVLNNLKNEALFFPSAPSTTYKLKMNSSNPNVSPWIDLAENPRLRMHNYVVNDNTTNDTTETTTNSFAQSRYLSQPFTLETVSTGARIIVTAASTDETSFDVLIRTSSSTGSLSHKESPYVYMSLDPKGSQSKSLSKTITEFVDYTFVLDGLTPFDVYNIKILLWAKNKHTFPSIDNYRVIILST